MPAAARELELEMKKARHGAGLDVVYLCLCSGGRSAYYWLEPLGVATLLLACEGETVELVVSVDVAGAALTSEF